MVEPLRLRVTVSISPYARDVNHTGCENAAARMHEGAIGRRDFHKLTYDRSLRSAIEEAMLPDVNRETCAAFRTVHPMLEQHTTSIAPCNQDDEVLMLICWQYTDLHFARMNGFHPKCNHG